MTIKLSIPAWMIKLSNYIDDKFFPLPELNEEERLALLHKEQKKIEDGAVFIRRQIESAKKLRHTMMAFRMIENFKRLYGHTTQGSAAADSLHLQNYNKQQDIISKM
jgi:hypothetical protein